jgi:hypothetical protein
MTETIVDFNMQIYSKLGNQGDYIKFLAKTFDNVGDALNEMRVSHQIETQLQSQGAVEDEEDSVTREQRALLSIANANLGARHNNINSQAQDLNLVDSSTFTNLTDRQIDSLTRNPNIWNAIEEACVEQKSSIYLKVVIVEVLTFDPDQVDPMSTRQDSISMVRSGVFLMINSSSYETKYQ